MTMNLKKKKKNMIGNFLLWVAEKQNKHWILSLFFIRLLAIWFSLIINFFGEALCLIRVLEGKKQLTFWGYLGTGILIIVVTLGEIASRYYNRKKEHDKDNNGAAFILRSLRNATSSLCDSKYNTLVNQIHTLNNNPKGRIPEIVSNPEKQLEDISSGMANCLCELLQEDKGKKWRTDDVCVSLAYEYPHDEPGTWHWVTTNERGLSLEQLLKESDDGAISTMKYCLGKPGNKVFFNSKESACTEKHYLPDPNDEYDSDDKLLGSIACFEDTIKKNDIEYIHYVLTISTNDRQFVTLKEDDYSPNTDAKKALRELEDNVKFNIYNNIVRDFLKRTRVEFCLLYLSRLKHSKP